MAPQKSCNGVGLKPAWGEWGSRRQVVACVQTPVSFMGFVPLSPRVQGGTIAARLGGTLLPPHQRPDRTTPAAQSASTKNVAAALQPLNSHVLLPKGSFGNT